MPTYSLLDHPSSERGSQCHPNVGVPKYLASRCGCLLRLTSPSREGTNPGNSLELSRGSSSAVQPRKILYKSEADRRLRRSPPALLMSFIQMQVSWVSKTRVSASVAAGADTGHAPLVTFLMRFAWPKPSDGRQSTGAARSTTTVQSDSREAGRVDPRGFREQIPQLYIPNVGFGSVDAPNGSAEG